MTDDFIPIPLFIIFVGGGIIIGVLIASGIYENKLKKAKEVLSKLIKDIEENQ